MLLKSLTAVAIALPALFATLSASAAGDPQAGEGVFKKTCALCHNIEEGKNKIGPSLHAVIGRHSASVADFQYSEAMKKADKTWDAATLDEYLANPRGLVPGTKMIYPGLKSDQDRQNLIAYLTSLQ
jgi:cytochrome c